MFSRKVIVSCIVIASFIVPAGAMAAGASNCPASACSVYTDPPPSAGNSKATSGKTKTVAPSVTTRKALKTVKKRAHRKTLKILVTDSRYGASFGKIPVAAVKTPSASVGRSLGAVITSSGSGSTGRLGALLAVIVLTTLAIGINAIQKQRT